MWLDHTGVRADRNGSVMSLRGLKRSRLQGATREGAVVRRHMEALTVTE